MVTSELTISIIYSYVWRFRGIYYSFCSLSDGPVEYFLKRIKDTVANVVSGTSEFLPLQPPVPDTRGGRSSLKSNYAKFIRLHIFEVRDLGDALKWS